MLPNRTAKFVLLLFIGALLGQPLALAQTVPVIGPLSAADQQYMSDSKAQLDALARSRLGERFSGDKDRDLAIIQTLLDRRLVKPDQTRELQAMGMILGDLLARELGMHWVVYSDRVGRSRALRMAETEHYLFPVTSISRRVEADAPVDVAAVYAKQYGLMAPYRRQLPFQ